MNVEGKRYVGGDFPVHLLTMGKLFNKRLVPCAFGIKIGLYFQEITPEAFCLGSFNFNVSQRLQHFQRFRVCAGECSQVHSDSVKTGLCPTAVGHKNKIHIILVLWEEVEFYKQIAVIGAKTRLKRYPAFRKCLWELESCASALR